MTLELSTPVVRAPSSATFLFTSHPSVQAFKLSPPGFLARYFDPSNKTRPPAPKLLATGAIVFDRPVPAQDGTPTTSNHPPPRVLLIQRAPTDSMPLKWETPGGGCDDDDPSILYACARELKEEAGLDAVSVGPVVACETSTTRNDDRDLGSENGQTEWGERMGGQFFLTRRGYLVCKFYFAVEVPRESASKVVLDPNEHAAFVWATEDEVRNKKMEGEDGIQLDFTTRYQHEVILEAFKMWKSA